VKASDKKLRFSFTKPKFMGLPNKQQHKKCASMLRYAYDLILSKQSGQHVIDHYNDLQEWMDGTPLKTDDLKQISNRYHEHLREAEVSFREHNLLPRLSNTDKEQGEESWPIAIYLDHIRSAHNVGSILRTVEGLRLGTVYLSDQTPAPDHKQVQDASMGAHEHVPCFTTNDIHSLPRPLVVMETSPEAIPIHEYIFPESFTLVLGNEEYGCSEELLAQADHLITIPMRGRKNSLNVANAFSMAAQEIVRQRQV
jgi:tRNA G18 (ribose-2'-O)-methylase SpoU